VVVSLRPAAGMGHRYTGENRRCAGKWSLQPLCNLCRVNAVAMQLRAEEQVQLAAELPSWE
jgi:hypothetical protein